MLSGRVEFRVDRRDGVLGAGESAAVPPGAVHDWWQVGEEEAQVLVEVAPGQRFVQVVATTFGLARDGKVDRRGLPHLLQAAVSLRAYRDAVVFATPPVPVQRLLFGALAPLGRALGRRPTYPQYLVSDEIVDLDPVALGLLDPTGRLRPPGARTEVG